MKYLKSFRFWEIFSKYLLLGLSLYIIALGSSNTDLLNRGIQLIGAQEDTEYVGEESLYSEMDYNPYPTVNLEQQEPLNYQYSTEYETVYQGQESLYPDYSSEGGLGTYETIYLNDQDSLYPQSQIITDPYETVYLGQESLYSDTNTNLYDTIDYSGQEPLYPDSNTQPLYETVYLGQEPLYSEAQPLNELVYQGQEPLYPVVPAPAPLPSYPIVAVPQQPAGPSVVFSNSAPVSSNANLGPYVLYRAAVACEGRNTVEETRWSDGRSERRNIGNTGFCPGQDSPIVANAAPIQSSNPQSGRYVLYTALKCNIPSPFAVTEETRWSDGSVTERNLGVTGYCGTPQPNVVSNPGAPIPLTNPSFGSQSAPVSGQPTNPILATCNVSGTNPFVNELVTYSVSASGGSGALRFRWSNDDTITGREGQAIQTRYTTAGIRTPSVVVSDSKGESIIAFCPQVSVMALSGGGTIPNPGGPNPPSGGGVTSPIVAYCNASATNPLVGQSIVLAINVSGGNGNFRYVWDNDQTINGRQGQSIVVAYSSEGIRMPMASVSDTAGNSIIAFCPQISVTRPFANVPIDGQAPAPIAPPYNTTNQVVTYAPVQSQGSAIQPTTTYAVQQPVTQSGTAVQPQIGQTNQTTDTTKQPVVVQQNTTSNIKELPKTGLPLIAWGITSLVPVGLRLRKWGSKGQTLESNFETANSIWMEKEFNRV